MLLVNWTSYLCKWETKDVLNNRKKWQSHTYGHSNLGTETAQWADSVKILWQVMIPRTHIPHLYSD